MERTVRADEVLVQAVLDALVEHVALLDGSGTIRRVNAAWVRFAQENGAPDLTGCAPGDDYFAACRAADGPEADLAQRAESGIRAVLAGAAQSFSLEYPCHSPTEQRWFVMTAVPVPPTGALVSHTDVSVEHAADHDPLTGVPTRRLLTRQMADVLAGSGQPQGPGPDLAVLYMDVDGFKEVNETLGPDRADSLLVSAVDRLAGILPSGAMLGRFASDEFVAAVPGIGRPAATALAERICADMRAPFDLDGDSIMTTVSVGVALHPQDGAGSNELIRAADAAMSEVKRAGRDGWRLYDARVSASRERRVALASGLRGALSAGEFHLEYQPQLSLADGRVVGVEALLRWDRADLGQPGPGEFVPVAESTGRIVAIGEWVLRTALRQACAWRAEGIHPGPVAVNLSGRHFVQPGFVDAVAGALSGCQLPADLLELAITEHWAIRQREATTRVMHELHDLGIRFSLDDFGTGYSSLANLRTFPIDALKIDRSFVAPLDDDPTARALVRSMISIGRSLDLRCVAEGVETRAQERFLRLARCEVIQGLLVGPPMPADAFAAWYREHGG